MKFFAKSVNSATDWFSTLSCFGLLLAAFLIAIAWFGGLIYIGYRIGTG